MKKLSFVLVVVFFSVFLLLNNRSVNLSPATWGESKGNSMSFHTENKKNNERERSVGVYLKSVLEERSLQGTDIDGDLHYDENGDLVIGLGVRQLFDYFLSTLGTQKLPDIVHALHEFIDARLPDPAAGQAKQLLSKYIQYKRAVSELQNDYDGLITDMSLHMERLNNLRHDHFSPIEYDAFFSEEERHNQDMLVRLGYPGYEHRAQVSASETRKMLERHHDINVRLEMIEQQGLTEDDKFVAREKLVGTQAAVRLSELGEQRLLWKKKINAYLHYVETLQQPGLTEVDKSDLLRQYQRQYFSALERRRLPAWVQ